MKKNLLVALIVVSLLGCKKLPNLNDDNYQTVVYLLAIDSITKEPITLHSVGALWIEDISPNNKQWKYGTNTNPNITSEVFVLPNGEKYYMPPVKCTPSVDNWDSKGLVFSRTKTLIELYGDADTKYYDTIVMDIANTAPDAGYAQKVWVNGDLKWNRDTCTTDYSRATPILQVYHNKL